MKDCIITIFAYAVFATLFFSITGFFLWILNGLFILMNIDMIKMGIFFVLMSISIGILHITSAWYRNREMYQHNNSNTNKTVYIKDNSINTSYKWKTEQISPNGKKTYTDKKGNLILNDEEKKDPNTSIIKSIYISFISIFYGSNGNKIASIHRSVYGNHTSSDSVISKTFTSQKFNDKTIDDLLTITDTTTDYSDTNSLLEEAKTYNIKPPTNLFVWECEYVSGHRIVQKIKTSIIR